MLRDLETKPAKRNKVDPTRDHDKAGTPTTTFRVTDGQASVPVTFTGVLPDLFREGQGIVAIGSMTPAGTFAATCRSSVWSISEFRKGGALCADVDRRPVRSGTPVHTPSGRSAPR